MESQEKASKLTLKKHNENLIIQTIYINGPITRLEVAETTKLTRTTVDEVVKQLIKEKLVEFEDIGRARVALGRTPKLVRIRKDARHIIAVDLSSDRLRGALVNLRGEIKESMGFDLVKGSEEDILQQIFKIIDALKNLSKNTPLLGIGLSTTGVVNMDTGVLVFSELLDLHNVHFKEMLRGHYDPPPPVYVMNDGQALALGEYTLFPGTPVTNLIVIKTGAGIGGGLILNGKVFYGDGYGAGEMGSIVVGDAEDGIQGNRSNVVPLSAVARDSKIIDRAQERASQTSTSKLHRECYKKSPLSLKLISEAAHKGDSVALHTIAETGRYFGRVIGYMVNILNVHHIRVSGDIHVLGEVLRKAMEDEIKKTSVEALAKKTTIELVNANPDTILIGAATQLLTHAYGIPRFFP
jgi:N-acetylglucosamine repressor